DSGLIPNAPIFKSVRMAAARCPGGSARPHWAQVEPQQRAESLGVAGVREDDGAPLAAVAGADARAVHRHTSSPVEPQPADRLPAVLGSEPLQENGTSRMSRGHGAVEAHETSAPWVAVTHRQRDQEPDVDRDGRA